jgi:hypothetical protein
VRFWRQRFWRQQVPVDAVAVCVCARVGLPRRQRGERGREEGRCGARPLGVERGPRGDGQPRVGDGPAARALGDAARGERPLRVEHEDGPLRVGHDHGVGVGVLGAPAAQQQVAHGAVAARGGRRRRGASARPAVLLLRVAGEGGHGERVVAGVLVRRPEARRHSLVVEVVPDADLRPLRVRGGGVVVVLVDAHTRRGRGRGRRGGGSRGRGCVQAPRGGAGAVSAGSG